MNTKNMIIGALVADAFALGAHWIYDTEKIKKLFNIYDQIHQPIPDSFHDEKKAGDQTHYGDQLVFFYDYLHKNGGFTKESFLKEWYHFMAEYKGYIDTSMTDTMVSIANGGEWGGETPEISGCFALGPLIDYYIDDDPEEGLKKILIQTKSVHNNDLVLITTEFFAKVLYQVIHGTSTIEAMKRAEDHIHNPWLSEVLNKARTAINMESSEAIKKLGQACHVEQILGSTVYLLYTEGDNFKVCLRKNVMAGGDSASRGMILGMILALTNPETIPVKWIESVKALKNLDFELEV